MIESVLNKNQKTINAYSEHQAIYSAYKHKSVKTVRNAIYKQTRKTRFQ